MDKNAFVEKLRNNKYIFGIAVILIVLYPLRWSFTGLDLWDSGYNCVSYVNFGMEYMNPSLFFSTYLSVLTGHVITQLPFGDTFAGMRIMCGIVICINVAVTAAFCVKELKLDRWGVIFGELLAVSLCYSPTVILYNHLSFLVLNVALIFLYSGLKNDKALYLFVSGALLGLNVFVRFPNIVQTVLIIGVWYYLKLRGRDVREYFVKTLTCVSGYLVMAGLMLCMIGMKYGLSRYPEAIRGLFSMNAEAQDYSTGSMISSMLGAYLRGGRRLFDIALFAAAAFAAVCVITCMNRNRGKEHNEDRILYCSAVLFSMLLIVFMVLRKLMQFNFHHYITVILTAAMFIDVAILECLVTLTLKESSNEDRMFAVLLILYVLSLSVGSNTGISPVMNCMFFIVPYMLNGVMKIVKVSLSGSADLAFTHLTSEKQKENAVKLCRTVSIVFAIVLAAFCVQCILFGMSYTYQEAENGAGGRAVVTNNHVLSGIRMSEERASWMQGLSGYVAEKGFEDSDVIVYGYSPSLVYFLGLKPVIGSWPDLATYSYADMERDMTGLQSVIDTGDRKCPLIILDNDNLEERIEVNPAKWELIEAFMDKYGYTGDYSDGRFSVFVPAGAFR